MAITTTKGLAPDWYIPLSEKEDDKPAQFLLAPLTQLEFLNVMSAGENIENDNGDMFFKCNESGLNMLLKKVQNWKNVLDPDGENLKFTFNNLKRSMPAEILSELANQVIIMSTMTGEDSKN